MILMGLSGALLDRALGTSMWTVVGFVLGVGLAVLGMFYVVKVAEFENRQDRDRDRQDSDRIDSDRIDSDRIDGDRKADA
jgi:F0F1-type ATP synthase assembly protein I